MEMDRTRKLLISGDTASIIKIWDLTSNQCIQTLPSKYKFSSRSTAMSYLDGTLGRGDHLGKLDLWKLTNDEKYQFEPVATLDNHIVVGCIQLFSSDRLLAVVGGTDILCWNTADLEKRIFTLTHEKEITCMDQQAENVLATGSIDGKVALWDLKSCKKIQSADKAHTGEYIWTIKSHGENKLITGASDCLVKMWDIRNLSTSLHKFEGHNALVGCVDADETVIASGSNDGCVKLWNPITGLCIREFVAWPSMASWVWTVKLADDYIVCGSPDSLITIFNFDYEDDVAIPSVASKRARKMDNCWIS